MTINLPRLGSFRSSANNFYCAKACRVIDWSWLLVLIPVWVAIGLLILGVIIALFVKAYMDHYK